MDLIQKCSEKPLENGICSFKYVGEDFRGQERNQLLKEDWLILEVKAEGFPDGLKVGGHGGGR